MNFKKIILTSLSVAILLFVVGCGKKWECDYCGDQWTGKAYRDYDGYPLCEDCAIEYWMPLPYQNYEIK